MKRNLIATSLIAAGVMMVGNVDAQSRDGFHIKEVRDLIAAEIAARGAEQVHAVGDNDTGFNPIEPCRIADTRSATAGRLVGGVVRNFPVDAADLSFQGGDPAGCDLPDNVSALSLNVTVVTPSGAGFLTAFPGGTGQPATATVNYTANSIVGNGSLIAVGDGVDVFSFAATDVVIDVTGYFADLAANELDCFTTGNAPDLVEAGEIFVGFAFCDVGYAAVGGLCDQNAQMPLVGAGTLAEADVHFCAFNNLSSMEDAGATTDVACCRVQPVAPVVPAEG